MADKATVMVLKVDLQCPCCYKKIKKILCKFPEIRDQVYNEKANMVTITVVCCSPEKIRDKICRKGRKVIECIKIVEPPKPKPEDPDKQKEHGKEKKKCGVTCKDSPKEPPKPDPPKPDTPKPDPPKPDPPKPDPPKPDTPKPDPPKPDPPKPTPCVPPCPHEPRPEPGPFCCPRTYPAGYCCGSCYEGDRDGPCHHGFKTPPPPPPPPSYCACGCGGYGYGYGRGCNVNRCGYYIIEENQQGCSIM